jgi:hypothetical protein
VAVVVAQEDVSVEDEGHQGVQNATSSSSSSTGAGAGASADAGGVVVGGVSGGVVVVVVVNCPCAGGGRRDGGARHCRGGGWGMEVKGGVCYLPQICLLLDVQSTPFQLHSLNQISLIGKGAGSNHFPFKHNS